MSKQVFLNLVSSSVLLSQSVLTVDGRRLRGFQGWHGKFEKFRGVFGTDKGGEEQNSSVDWEKKRKSCPTR